MSRSPSARVLAAFGAAAPAALLRGGQGLSWRAGDLVLKPVDEEDETRWRSDLLAQLPEAGFRIARPVRTQDGSWICDGWAATRWVDGEPGPQLHWRELLAGAEAFLWALRTAPRPTFLGRRTHWWALADRAAWDEAQLPLFPDVRAIREQLASLAAPVDDRAQLVHGDLAGNVLFHPTQPPAVIDLSPYWRPARYAIGIAIADLLLHYGAGPDLLPLAARHTSPPLVARGALFRLYTLDQAMRSIGRTPQPTDLRPYRALADAVAHC